MGKVDFSERIELKWIKLAQGIEQWPTLVNVVINIRVP